MKELNDKVTCYNNIYLINIHNITYEILSNDKELFFSKQNYSLLIL